MTSQFQFKDPPCKTVPVEFESSKADSVSFCSPSQEGPAIPNRPAIAQHQAKTGEQIEEGHLKGPTDVSFPWHEEVVEHLLKSKKVIKWNQFMVSIDQYAKKDSPVSGNMEISP